MNPFKQVEKQQRPPKLACFIRRLKRDERGAILAEIGLALPLLLGMLTGVVEVGNYLLVNLKLQHTVVSIADLTTRDENITGAVLADIFNAAPQIMAPFDMGADAVVIVSAISQNEDTPASVFWQRSGGGTLDKDSEFGIEGEAPNLPDGLTLRDDETILATEIYYAYRPLIFQFLPEQVIRKSSFFRPRIGALQEIE
ncbi:TadE/TadG family type IV pilus assembly protein [Kordiimonas aquimaris]|uniref:TadE/TadG family type IV pilus assembly protein n=1 Tax=Kordiimonas aquimaris TaxID=707591 RepID=UPI0021D0D646|nr:TadE/TadG family type IV pilus assembly protein [Kordiimonas aquimaris]